MRRERRISMPWPRSAPSTSSADRCAWKEDGMIPVTHKTGFEARNVERRFVRAAGPGGQNAGREATAVELRFDIAASSLPDDVKARLTALGGRRGKGARGVGVGGRGPRAQARKTEGGRA